MSKCADCKETYDDDKIIVLAESNLGFGSIGDYYMCVHCYDIETRRNNAQ